MISILRDKQKEIDTLCRKYGVKQLDVFGSASDGTFEDGRSDIDFWVEFFPKEPVQYSDDFWAFEDALRQLLNTQIDLVEAKAQKNPYFIRDVLKSKVPLYAAA